MRVVVTGREGQVVRALCERGPQGGIEIVPLGRPELDLARPETIMPAIRQARPDLVVGAAAHTAVDQAESEPELAMRINGEAAGELARSAAAVGVPLIHLSTDFVFDGAASRPYREDNPAHPLSAYGRSKRAGEVAVAASGSEYAILRTAWIYSPFGRNFVRTMLRLGENREQVRVVDDQRGSPTGALDLADGIIKVAANILAATHRAPLLGLFHLAGAGEASWADLAEVVFDEAAACGRPQVHVDRIATAEYPTPARRPANSRLDCSRIASVHGIVMPDWRGSVRACVRRLLATVQERSG